MKQYGAKTIILAILLQLAITFVVAAACGLVCAVLMLPLGFQYDGLWAIVVFFFFGSVLSRPLPRHCTPPKCCPCRGRGCAICSWTPLPRPFPLRRWTW